MTSPSSTPSRDEGLSGVLRRGDLGVLAVGALLLLAGWFIRAQHLEQPKLYRGHGLSLEVPATWLLLSGPSSPRALFSDMLVTEAFKPTLEIGTEPLPAGLKTEEIPSFLQLDLQQGLHLFHLVAARTIRLGPEQRQAFRVDYAYAMNPAARPDDPVSTDIPVAIRATTIALVHRGQLVRLAVKQSISQNQLHPELANRILSSVKLAPVSATKGASR